MLRGVVVTQVQDPAHGLVEPHTVGLGPSIQSVQFPLQGLPTLKQINTPPPNLVSFANVRRHKSRQQRREILNVDELIVGQVIVVRQYSMQLECRA